MNNLNFYNWNKATYQSKQDPTNCTTFVVLCKRCQGELEESEINNDMSECNECIQEQEEEGRYLKDNNN